MLAEAPPIPIAAPPTLLDHSEVSAAASNDSLAMRALVDQIDPRPELRSADDTQAWRSYNRTFGLVAVAILGGIVLLNLVVDPYRVFHDAWRLPYPSNERHLVPGLVRHTRFDYDAVTIGTSHSANFQPRVMEQVLGWRTLRCTLDGSTMPEQLLALRTALDAGRVRHVLWGIDFFALFEPSEKIDRGRIPVHLYERSWRTPFQYLLSGSTAHESYRVLKGRGETDLAERGHWYPQQVHRFGEARMLEAAPAWLDYKRQQGLRPAPEVMDRNLDEIARTIREHPGVEFVCLLPPVSVLSAVADFEDGGKLFDERLRFRERLFEAVAALPNACVYDFEQAFDVTHNFELYKDPTHYNQAVSDWMISEIRAGHHRVWPGDAPAFQREFELRTRAYIQQIKRPDHPFYALLHLERQSPERIAIKESRRATQ